MLPKCPSSESWRTGGPMKNRNCRILESVASMTALHIMVVLKNVHGMHPDLIFFWHLKILDVLYLILAHLLYVESGGINVFPPYYLTGAWVWRWHSRFPIKSLVFWSVARRRPAWSLRSQQQAIQVSCFKLPLLTGTKFTQLGFCSAHGSRLMSKDHLKATSRLFCR